MRFFVVAASVAVALAMPGLDARGGGGGGGGQGQLCYSGVPQCCATDVLGVADLDCAPREFLLPALESKEIAHPHYFTYSPFPAP